MPLINYEINLILTWFENCVLSSRTAENPAKSFATTDTKLYILVVNLSINNNK